MKIEWDVREGTSGKIYFSDEKSEFVISKEDNFWVLRYTDFWTVSPNSFLVTVKKGGDEMLTVHELKNYAQKVFDLYNNYPEILTEL